MNIPTICPFCGHRVVYTSNAAIYGRVYGNGMCYKCTNCDSYVGCHPNGQPLGTLGNKQTRDLRHKCHNIFDTTWRLGHLDRNYCYTYLANRLGIPRSECHFAYFDIPMLTRVLEVLPQIKKELLEGGMR